MFTFDGQVLAIYRPVMLGLFQDQERVDSLIQSSRFSLRDVEYKCDEHLRNEGSYIPIYDYACDTCSRELPDQYRKIDEKTEPCPDVECEGTMQRVWTQSRRAVIGDEIDVWIKNALCNPDGSPRHFRSRQELARFAAEKGYSNYVEHKGSQGSDKSKHTSRWI